MNRTPARLTERIRPRFPAGKLGRAVSHAAMALLLAGCSWPTAQASNFKGEVVPVALVMAPLCLVICPVTVTTTGTDTDTIAGDGATASPSTSTAQTVTTGAIN